MVALSIVEIEKVNSSSAFNIISCSSGVYDSTSFVSGSKSSNDSPLVP